MITPVFEVSEDDDFVIIMMKVPHMKVSSFDFYIDDDTFKFYAKPYFLRLVFPGSVVEDGRERAEYSVEDGVLRVWVPKGAGSAGKRWGDLDLLTLLKARPRAVPEGLADPLQVLSSTAASTTTSTTTTTTTTTTSSSSSMRPRALIEEIDQPGEQHSEMDEDDACEVEQEQAEVEFDWSLPQELPQAPASAATLLLNRRTYGFNNRFSGYFAGLQGELSEIIELPDPDVCAPADRQASRVLCEDLKFDPEHYMADFMHDESVQEVLHFRPWWITATTTTTTEEPSESIFTEEEKEALRSLPNKEYLLSPEEERAVWISLVDLLFAFAYDHRTTLGDATVESHWTIRKVSATLSWLQQFESVHEAVVACVRRSLAYPLYRHWQLSVQVVRDTQRILELGKRYVLRCLLAMRRALVSEFSSHLNTLYIDDYCCWLQRASNRTLRSLAAEVAAVASTLQKADTAWPLEEYETEARESEQEPEEEEEAE